MTQNDYWTDTLRRKEKADEDRYFTEQDRKLIKKLHQRHPPAQETELSESDGQVAPDPSSPKE